MDRNQQTPREVKEFEEKIIEIRRVSKKTKGGNKINFSALVVIGDHNGRAGVGFSKAPDVLSTIQKSIRLAKKNLIKLDLVDGTIPHQILHKRGAAVILLKPAPVGTGVIAGGAVRAVVEAFGIRNIVSKCMGTSNKISNVYATFEALTSMRVLNSKIQLSSEQKQKSQESEVKEPTLPGNKLEQKLTANSSQSKRVDDKKTSKTVKKLGIKNLNKAKK
jgi:small subunit ribosomal protein S5